jgi:hypothetical protein
MLTLTRLKYIELPLKNNKTRNNRERAAAVPFQKLRRNSFTDTSPRKSTITRLKNQVYPTLLYTSCHTENAEATKCREETPKNLKHEKNS